jgi:hypothetical protein
VKNRKIVENKMTPSQIEKAEKWQETGNQRKRKNFKKPLLESIFFKKIF